MEHQESSSLLQEDPSSLWLEEDFVNRTFIQRIMSDQAKSMQRNGGGTAGGGAGGSDDAALSADAGSLSADAASILADIKSQEQVLMQQRSTPRGEEAEAQNLAEKVRATQETNLLLKKQVDDLKEQASNIMVVHPTAIFLTKAHLLANKEHDLVHPLFHRRRGGAATSRSSPDDDQFCIRRTWLASPFFETIKTNVKRSFQRSVALGLRVNVDRSALLSREVEAQRIEEFEKTKNRATIEKIEQQRAKSDIAMWSGS